MVDWDVNADPLTVSVKAAAPAMVYVRRHAGEDGRGIRRILDGVGCRGHGAGGITAGYGDGLKSFRRGNRERA